MSDFLSGQTLTPLHFTPTVSATETGSFTFNATTYGVDNDSGTYADCGVAFVAPATGRVWIAYSAQLSNSGANATIMAPHVRTGGTVGAGTDVVVAQDANRIFTIGTSGDAKGSARLITGLTPGDTYNVRLEHKVLAGVGTLVYRHVIVSPAT